MIHKACIVVIGCLIGASPMAIAEDGKWISAEISVGNSVGLGTFFSGPGSVPQWTTSFAVAPSVALPLPSSWPRFVLDAEVSANFWWLKSIDTSAFDATHRIQFQDLALSLSAPSIIEFPMLGLSLSPSIPVLAPVSKASLALNRWLSLGLGVGMTWKKKQFAISFAPSARVWIHGGEAKTIGCFDADNRPSLSLLNPQNSDFQVDQYMMALSVFRDEESVDGANCTLVGRQNTWTLKLPVGAAFIMDAHRVSLNVAYYWNFLRPLEYRPELSSPNSSGQSFTQAVLGRAAYTYTLPLPVDLAVSAGLISFQSVFSKIGTPLFPFVDFVTPVKNQTQVFVEMTASL